MACRTLVMKPVGSKRVRKGSPGLSESPYTLKLRMGPVAPGIWVQSKGLPALSTTAATRVLPEPLGVVSALPLFTPGKNRKMPCRASGVSTTASVFSFWS